jgi:putative ABC transport system permease protein
MRTRLRAWLEETHSDNFELVRHFLDRFFDSEGLAAPDEWTRVAGGVVAVLISAGILALTTYSDGFKRMEDAGLSKERIFQTTRADELTFIGVAMGITALLTSFQWQALFPSRRDCLALASLPVSARQIFLAKFGALLLVFAVFVVSMNLPWALEFAAATAGHWAHDPGIKVAAANFAAMGGVCVFVFFSLLAVQGILLNLLPVRTFARVSLVVQAAVFIATMGVLPLFDRQPVVAWWPPVWFLDLWGAMIQGTRGTGNALFAMTVPVVLSVLAYLLSYHRYRRLLLEGESERAPSAETGWGARTCSWLLEKWMPEPRQQGAFAFIWKTLSRSRTHRLILLAYAGIALGAVTKGAVDMPRPSLKDEGLYGLLVVLAPLGLALLITVGLRYLFSLPESLRANWVFQINDREGRKAWLTSTARFVVCCGIAPVFAIALPAAVAILGWTRAGAVTILSFSASLLWFEILFRKWRKLAFTCSYLPGKQPVWLILVRYAVAASLVAPAGNLILYSSAEPTAFAALLTFLAAMWWKLRSARRKMWAECALEYEEAQEAAVMSLNLKQPLGDAPSPPPPAPPPTRAELEYQPTLLGSSGLLPAAWREEIREERRHPAMLFATAWEDIRLACRLIRRNPLLSAAVLLTLTIGIGINASIFTIVNAVALRPHIDREPERFLRIFPMARLQGRPRAVSYPEYVELRDQSRTVRHLVAVSVLGVALGDEELAESTGLAVSCNFFLAEGLDRPMMGRLFVPDDCQAEHQIPVAVIAESVWRNRFRSDPHVIGQTVRINNRSVILVGVVRAGTSAWMDTLPVEIWLPVTAVSYFEPARDVMHRDDLLTFNLVGRLGPGFTRGQAETELQVLERQLDREHPGRRTSVETTNGSLASQWALYATAQSVMLMGFFFGTFNMVLFLACANVATLLLSRAAARRREIAVRLSLGAPRIRLLRMLVTESVLLAAGAGIASIFVAWRVPKPLYHYLASRQNDFAMPPDWRTFAYIAGVVLVTGILAGVAPALESLKVDVTAALKGVRGFFGSASLRGLLVSTQVALSMVLLVEAGLFARSEERALRADPGYAPQKVVVTWLRFPDSTKAEAVRARVEAIAQRVRALPGVGSVAFSDELPLVRPETVELRPPRRQDASQPVDVYTASPDFFRTMGIPVLRGREFQESDAAAVIVSESLAKAFWPRQEAVGRTLMLPDGAVPVVGVARDIAPMRLGGSDNPAVYSMRHIDARLNVMSARLDNNPAAGAVAIRAVLRQLEPDVFLMPWLLQSWFDRLTANLWNVASLIVVLAAVATVLAAIGIYGAVSFAVNQRTRDLGIRVALGATRLRIVREVLMAGGRPVAHGLIAGLWLAVPTAAGLHESFTNSPVRLDNSEPLLYCAAALALATAAVVAMLGPARRAANSDPLEALRWE